MAALRFWRFSKVGVAQSLVMKNLKTNKGSDRPLAGDIDHLIITIRGQRVILDADLTSLYGVSTRKKAAGSKKEIPLL